MRHLTQHARTLRRNMTDAEQFLWKHLRNKQLNGLKFRRQQPIGSYIVDFVCFEKKLVIEVDGGQHASQEEADHERDQWLQKQGLKVLRFWNNEVLGNTAGVIEQVLDHCL